MGRKGRERKRKGGGEVERERKAETVRYSKRDRRDQDRVSETEKEGDCLSERVWQRKTKKEKERLNPTDKEIDPRFRPFLHKVLPPEKQMYLESTILNLSEPVLS